LQIYHQNTQGIQGIQWKTDETLDFLSPALPHVLCFTEHHLNQYETEHLHINNYTLGAKYCRHSSKKGGVCIFVHNGLDLIYTDLEKFSNDQDTEACAIEYYIILIISAFCQFLEISTTSLIITDHTSYYKYTVYYLQ
jgi:hypothetical protein